MSIARLAAKPSRSFRTLMFPATLHLLQIKDLKDLSVFFCRWDTIDMQVLTDLKRFFTGVIAGDRPPRYGHIETRRSLLPGSHRNMKNPRLCASQILTCSTSPVSNERFAASVTANVFTESA